MPARPGTAIYLDANAGAPLRPSVIEALGQLVSFSPGSFSGNPSSIHSHGRRAKKLMADGRESVALSLGARTDPEQLIFCSSGSEANQLAIRATLEGAPLGAHWITTPVEHDSVLQLVKWFTESRQGNVSFLPVDEQGAPRADALAGLLRPETRLLSVVYANNETGVVSDVGVLAAALRARSPQVLFHLDAAQAWGKLPLDVTRLGAELVTFSGHKIGALAGTGVLYLAPGTPFATPLIRGKQEKARRGGTENLAGIISAGAAASTLDPLAWAARVAPLRDRLEDVISQRIPGTRINGRSAAAGRVANTAHFSFAGLEGEGLVMALDLAGYSVSAGSACSSGVLEPSHVLLALGRSKAEALSSIRVSLVDALPWAELEPFIDALSTAVARMRGAGTVAAIGAGT